MRHRLFQFQSFSSSCQTLEETIRAAVEAKAYQQVPDLFLVSKLNFNNPSPFSFLSTFSQNQRTRVIDEILQSLISVRPRSRPKLVYDCLLSYTLQNPNPLPLALVILQRLLRSGCIPNPQTHLLLSSSWLDRRRQSYSVANILLEMDTIGYRADYGTCNYLISSLCSVDQLAESVHVLKGMAGAGCIPDSESYGIVISAMCVLRKTADAIEMLKEMMVEFGFTPRQGTVFKLASALRANREIHTAVKMVEFLETESYCVGFETYESVIECCLECKEYILAGQVVMRMTDKGLIPYIKVRQKIVDGLSNTGEWKFACAIRQRFAELKS